MKENKTEYLKARCTAGEKKKITKLADEMNVSLSNLLMSAIQALIESQTDNPSQKPVTNDYTLTVKKHLMLNSIHNIINLNPTIPDNTKQKIQKELEKI